MLLGQNCRRNQIDHLLIFLHCFEGCTDCDLRLSIAYIPTDQPIHNPGTLHISFYCLNGKLLILCFLKRKQLLELSLPDSIWSVHVAVLFLTRCIKLHQILCNLLNCASNLCFGLYPFASPKAVQFGFSGICSGILLDHLQLSRQNIEISSFGIFNLNIILHDLVYFYLLNSPIDAKTMVLMNHIIAYAEL